MKKRLRLLTSLAALLFFLTSSQVTWALGLGDIKTESALNEPLLARIELLNVASLSDRDLIVDIGSREDYRVAGVERDFFHTDLSLEAYVDGQAQPYISVTSTKHVIEPFLNFVVQVRWPQGKLLREYTILLDPPVFTGRSQQKTLNTPQTLTRQPAQTAPIQRNTGQRDTGATARAAPASTKSKASAGDEYLVQNGDTLWSLAGAIAQQTGTTHQQVIMAIRDFNPNAFINGDPNVLKAGVVLRMPDGRQAGGRSTSDAAAEFASIQRRSGRALEATPVRSSGNNFRDQAASDSSSAGRLALSSSGVGSGAVESTEQTAAETGLVNALSNENETLKEELDRVALENNDLRERLSALKEQLQVLELLSVENNDLASVQERLQAVDQSETEPVVNVQSAPEPEPSLVDKSMGFLPYIVAALVVLLLVGMMIMKRRKSASEEDDLLADELETDEPEEDLADEELTEGQPAAVADDVESFSEEGIDADDEEYEEGLESMDELFADDSDDAEPEQAEAEETADEEPAAEIEDVDDDDVEDRDLEGALEDLDEFADLDSFFDSDDIEDFDPDSAEGLDDGEDDVFADAEVTEDFADSEGETVAEEFDIDISDSEEEPDTDEADSDEVDLDEGDSGDDDSDEDSADEIGVDTSDSGMDFESFELPEEVEDEAAEDLHGEEHSMDFDGEIELPELSDEQDPLAEPRDGDANSMEFDLDDFDPIGGADASEEPADSAPAGNEMEFDAESIELPEEVDGVPAEDLHDEEHSMDFDDNIELSEVEEEETSIEEDSANTMAFDVDDLELPEERSEEQSAEESEDDLSNLDLDETDSSQTEEVESDDTEIGMSMSDLDSSLDLGDSDAEDLEDADLHGLDLGDTDLSDLDSSDEDLSELTADLESDMDELLAGTDDGEDAELDIAGDGIELPEVDPDTDEFPETDTELNDSLDLDEDLDLDKGLDLDDDLLADFDDDSGSDLEEEMNTRLELAEAYIDMADITGAKQLIAEILADGSDAQKEAAQKLADRING